MNLVLGWTSLVQIDYQAQVQWVIICVYHETVYRVFARKPYRSQHDGRKAF
jgi:hypothetical protein